MTRTVRSRAGAVLPALGQGTWRMGEDPSEREREVAALRLGIDLGLTLVDTAEMYGEGGAEKIVAEAIRGRRDSVFLVSKVLPWNASREGTVRACDRSLERLDTDRIDLYLLHWPGTHPLDETLEGFETLRRQGKILHHGVSNFDVAAMEQARRLRGAESIAVDQILYNLERRGVERRLLPWCKEHGVVVMAYSPFEQGRLGNRAALDRVAARHAATAARVAIAWTMRHGDTVAIPKATDPQHVRDNAAAADLVLTREDLDELDRAFPVPSRDVPLEIL